MKKILTCFLLVYSLSGYTQTKENFDLLSFTVPKGWKKEIIKDAVSFTITEPQKYARLIVYKSIPGTGILDDDFKKEWNDLVVTPYKTSATPELTEDDLPNDWKMKTGTAAFAFNGSQSVVILMTAASKGNIMSTVFLTNSDKYMADLETIGNSLQFKKATAVSTTTATAKNSQPGNVINADSKLFGKWNRSGAVHPSYADAASWGNAGYTSSRYEFKQDGSYLFTERSFRMTYPYIIIVKENGSYNVNGSQLTINPQKSTIQTYTKKNNVDELGSLVQTQNRPLESVTYNYQFHYFTGIQEWNLVLQAGKPTLRDGNFSNNNTFGDAWYFDQKFTNSDLTSPKGD